MEFGVHLPVIVANGESPSLGHFVRYGMTAERLGYATIATSDHVIARGPWLDGPTILSAVAGATSHVQLATAILLPVLRHPAVVAQAFGSLDRLSGNRVVLGVSGGVLRDEFDLMDIPWEERWQRLDDAIGLLRCFWSDVTPTYHGRFYNSDGLGPKPRPERGGPPIWIGSWGSQAGIRRAARLGDGWIASGFNIAPQAFKQTWQSLADQLKRLGKDPMQFDNALASVFIYVTEDDDEAERVAHDILAPALNRSPDELMRLALLGSAEYCASRLAEYGAAGVQRVWIWPATDSIAQIQRFAEEVIPLIT